MSIKQANTIDEVIQLLDEVIEKSKIEQSALGLFAALYREVTVKVKEGISDGSVVSILDCFNRMWYL